jgi:hypothetical protein
MTVTVPEVESIEHLDWDPQCGCRDCTNTARWIGHAVRPCGHRFDLPICDPCKETTQKNQPYCTVMLVCPKCGGAYSPTVVPVIYEPIR